MKKSISRTLRKLAHSSFSAVLLISSLYFSNAYAQVKPDSLLVLDSLGANFNGALYLVDPEGRRTILTKGPGTDAATDIAVAPSGFIFMTSPKILYRINPLTGNLTAISDLTNLDQGPGLPTGATGFFGLEVDSTGRIYATATVMFPPDDAVADALLRIDPETGSRVILSNLGDGSQGAVIKPTQRILLTNDETAVLVLGTSMIVRVNLANGTRQLVVNTLDPKQEVSIIALWGLAQEPSGNLLLISLAERLLYRFDITTKLLSVVCDLADAQTGPVARVLRDVAVDASGEVFVADQNFGAGGVHKGAIFKVDPSTCERSVLSDFGNSTQGPAGFLPLSIEFPVPVTPTAEDLFLARSVVVATEELKVQKGAVVKSGNLITNGSTGQALINKGATTPEGFEVAANALIIKRDAVVGGDVVVDNLFKNQGTVEGTETIGQFPMLEALPPFQATATGDAKILVNKGGFLSLPEGRFKSIIVGKGATLALEGGIYETETLKTGKGAEIAYERPIDLRMSKSAKLGKGSTVHPAKNSLLNAKDAVIYPGQSFKTGRGSEIQANIVGPKADCNFGKSSQLIGSAYCRTVTLGKSSRTTLMNFLEDSIVEGAIEGE